MNVKREICTLVPSRKVKPDQINKNRRMENSKKLEIKFINGEFTPEDAKELLLNVIAKKMQFHSVDSHSLWEKNAAEDNGSKKRLNELKMAREEILLLLTNDSLNGKKINIHSTIEIEVLD